MLRVAPIGSCAFHSIPLRCIGRGMASESASECTNLFAVQSLAKRLRTDTWRTPCIGHSVLSRHRPSRHVGVVRPVCRRLAKLERYGSMQRAFALGGRAFVPPDAASCDCPVTRVVQLGVRLASKPAQTLSMCAATRSCTRLVRGTQVLLSIPSCMASMRVAFQLFVKLAQYDAAFRVAFG